MIGNRTKVRVTKNKVAPPFREAEFDIMYNEGISKSGDVLDIATELEIVTKRGAFFAFEETRLGQGRENAKEYLKQNPELLTQIEQRIREHAVQAEAIVLDTDDEHGEDEALLTEEPLLQESETEAVVEAE